MGIEGTWSGHYVQARNPGSAGRQVSEYDSQFPVVVRFAVANDEIAGSLTDVRPERELTFREYVRLVRSRLTWWNRFRWGLACIRYPDGTVKMTRPTSSTVEGHIRGDEIVFTKTYIGEVKYLIRYGRRTRLYSLAAVPITYRGRLDPTGTTIHGTYEFPSSFDLPGDTFILNRMPESTG